MSIPSCLPGLPPSPILTPQHFERTPFPDKFNYGLTTDVIDQKLSGVQTLFRTLVLCCYVHILTLQKTVLFRFQSLSVTGAEGSLQLTFEAQR